MFGRRERKRPLQREQLDQLEDLRDDYPAVRQDYEDALRTFLRACKANGRTL